MLIDFTVENSRSIKDPVTLSAIEARRGPGRARQGTGKRRGIKTDDEIAPAAPVSSQGFALLPALGIFGANATGKTNVLRALDDLLWLMTYEGTSECRVVPFQLETHSAASPTTFTLRVAVAGAVYTYSLSTCRKRVFYEALEWVAPGEDAPTILFSRECNATSGETSWRLTPLLETIIKEPSALVPADQTLVCLLAKYDTHVALEPLATWLKNSLRGISLGYTDIERQITTYWVERQVESHKAILAFLRRFDMSIVDLQVRTESGNRPPEPAVFVSHDTPEGRVSWPLDYESLGTQRLYELAPKLLWTLHNGALALIDELGTNLHPYITERIVRLFQSPETNPKRAQLIFTSHDNTLLQNQLLRRDQVLFTEMRADGSTDLYSVSDFRARNDLALDRAYLDGRFGAVPVLPAEEDMLVPAGSSE